MPTPTALRVRRANQDAFYGALRVRAVARKAALANLREEISEETREAERIAEQEHAQQRADCSRSFLAFLRHWRFIDRETGTVRTFAVPWQGQREFVEAIDTHQWLFALKAGKLGFTELECAYDAWVALFRQQNANVGIFSKDLTAAKQLLRYVRFGLTRLPSWLGLPFSDGPGSQTTVSLILRSGPDDERIITSYAATPTTAVDRTLNHVHLDELSNVIDPEGVWGSVSTIVPDSGTMHVVTRGRGPRVYTARLWASCFNNGGEGKLFGFFASADKRPRPEGWREQQFATMTRQAASWYAPMTAADALAGDDQSQFVDVELLDACADPLLMPLPGMFDATFAVNLPPGDKTPVVLALDCGVKRDYFAAALISRHPERPSDPAIRAIRIWRPQDQPDHTIDFDRIERWIVGTCRGWCAAMHPFWREWKDPKCDSCTRAAPFIPGYKVVQIAYDVYQLAEMGQRLNRRKVAWAEEFGQTGPRLEADSDLRHLIVSRRLGCMPDPGNLYQCEPVLRAAVQGAAAEYQRGDLEERKLRIVKLAPDSKIDAVVAVSMGAKRCLYLNLGTGAGLPG